MVTMVKLCPVIPVTDLPGRVPEQKIYAPWVPRLAHTTLTFGHPTRRPPPHRRRHRPKRFMFMCLFLSRLGNGKRGHCQGGLLTERIPGTSRKFQNLVGFSCFSTVLEALFRIFHPKKIGDMNPASGGKLLYIG